MLYWLYFNIYAKIIGCLIFPKREYFVGSYPFSCSGFCRFEGKDHSKRIVKVSLRLSWDVCVELLPPARTWSVMCPSGKSDASPVINQEIIDELTGKLNKFILQVRPL
jgi:hypothetical protein